MDGRNDVVRVRLIKRLAAALDGVDLADARVGDILVLPVPHARLLVAEGWAVTLETRAPQAA